MNGNTDESANSKGWNDFRRKYQRLARDKSCLPGRIAIRAISHDIGVYCSRPIVEENRGFASSHPCNRREDK